MLKPLVIFKNIGLFEIYTLNFAYLPNKDLADVNDFRKEVEEIVGKLKKKDIWIEKIGEEIVKWFEKKYSPKGVYLVLAHVPEKVQCNFVSGEFSKDWDMKLEAQHAFNAGVVIL